MQCNTTGRYNVAIGNAPLFNNTTGCHNIAIGRCSMRFNTIGCRNIALGIYSLEKNTTGTHNVAIGADAMRNSCTGTNNVAIGYLSLAFGKGSCNVSIGNRAFFNMTTGSKNTAIGHCAGKDTRTNVNVTTIGYNAQPSAYGANNEITLGDAYISTIRANTTSISSLSDGRDKTNVNNLVLGSYFLKELRPVSFDWDRRDGSMKGEKDIGFIAQEVDELQKKYNVEDLLKMVLKTNPDRLEVSPGKLIPVLVKSIQDLINKIKKLEQRVETLEN